MTGQTSRRKGAAFERDIERYLDGVDGITARRVAPLGYAGGDIHVTTQRLELLVECKNRKTLALPEWWRQAVDDAQQWDTHHIGAPVAPLLVVKRPRTTNPAHQWAICDLQTLTHIIT